MAVSSYKKFTESQLDPEKDAEGEFNSSWYMYTAIAISYTHIDSYSFSRIIRRTPQRASCNEIEIEITSFEDS